MPFTIENNQLVLSNLVDSRTGKVIRIDLPTDPIEREKEIERLQEISKVAQEHGRKTRELLSKPCGCGEPWCRSK